MLDRQSRSLNYLNDKHLPALQPHLCTLEHLGLAGLEQVEVAASGTLLGPYPDGSSAMRGRLIAHSHSLEGHRRGRVCEIWGSLSLSTNFPHRLPCQLPGILSEGFDDPSVDRLQRRPTLLFSGALRRYARS